MSRRREKATGAKMTRTRMSMKMFDRLNICICTSREYFAKRPKRVFLKGNEDFKSISYNEVKEGA